MPFTKASTTWAQAAGKLVNSVGNGPSSSSNSEVETELDVSNVASKNVRMEENANESQIAAAFSDGWGQRGINQDTAWDVPSSPQLSPKEAGAWSNSTSTGTEIWENNVRHHIKSGGKPPNAIRESWAHTPTTHIGGTWGEEEDTTHVWTGVPQASGAPWRGETATSVWGANQAESTKNWANQSSSMNPSLNPNWANESPALQIGLPHLPLPNDNKNVAALQIGLPHVPMANDNSNMADENIPDVNAPWLDPSLKANRNFTNWSPVAGSGKKIPPTGWEESAQPPNGGQSGPGFDDGTAVWGNPVHQGRVSHWKDMPAVNKQMPNCTMQQGNMGPGMIRVPQSNSVLGKNMNEAYLKNQPPPMNHSMSWNDRDNSGRRIFDEGPDKGVPGTPHTPNSAFGSWSETGHPIGPYWNSKTKNASNWAEGQVDTSSWGGPMKQSGKPLSKDLIWASKQFRILLDMNYKKDDIENALRRSNMNLEDSLIELRALNNKDSSLLDMDCLMPRMQSVGEDMNFTDHSMDNSLSSGNVYGNNNFQGLNMFNSGFNVAQNVKSQNSLGNVATNLIGNAGTNNQMPNFNLSNGVNNLSPAMMRKILQTQGFNPGCLPQNTGRMSQQNSTAQLRLVVQQIQMAVQAGYLNSQILNQPLCAGTLNLLFQLLMQIRILHQQQLQLYMAQQGNKPGSPPLHLSVQITQTKQNIINLQNNIAAQQAMFLKQQQTMQPPQQQTPQPNQPQPHPALQSTQPSNFDVSKPNLDAINNLNSEFRDLSVKEPSTLSQGHSRLTQWKLSSFEKSDNPNEITEFSRAPGSVTKSSSANSLASTTAPHSSAVLQPLNEAMWSDVNMARPPNQDTWSDPETRNCGNNDNSDGNSESGIKHTSASDSNKDLSPANPTTPSSAAQQQQYNLNDLVQEFEPGKPWKGNSRIKNFEDDPHVTPGSITKSPLSVNSIKDSDLFAWNNKHSSASTTPSLTSSTWTYSPSDFSSNRSWKNQGAEQDRGSWKNQSPMPKSSRPPPGLSNQGWEKHSGSNFLVLKNLTPQIDGSTLKTLCLQHGPLQLFHLLLNHGIALVRYSTREETEKARSALNNCVLSNTTILVDIPTGIEVKQYLQLASGQMNSNVTWSTGNSNSDSNYSSTSNYPASQSSTGKMATGTNWNNPGINNPSSDLWGYSGAGNGLWNIQSPGSDHDQCIPSSLNSFLPGDLLGGGEPI